jgi:hypothetical protein
MAHKTNELEFFRTGLLRYADARDTVDYFESSVQKALLGAFNGKADWRHFVPDRDSSGNLVTGKGLGISDRFISVWMAGTLLSRKADSGRRVWVGMSVYWRPPQRTSASVVVSCHAWFEGNGLVPLLDVPDRDRRVLIGTTDRRNERKLFIEPAEDFDPSDAFSLLLASLDNGLASESSS